MKYPTCFAGMRRSFVCRYALLLILSLSLGACAGILSPGPAMTQLILPVNVPAREKPASPLPILLLVGQPLAATGASLDRVMAIMNGYEVKALDSAKWVEAIPVMLQRQLIETLDNSGQFEAVSREESGQDSRVRLVTEITKFYLLYETPGSAPKAEVACTFSLVDMHTGQLLGRTHSERTQMCAENSVTAFVDAFSKSWSGVLGEVRDWSGATLKGYRPDGRKATR